MKGVGRYPNYRDSGLAWLGEVPAHWEVRRNGRLFWQRVESGFAELPILEVSLRTGVRVRDLEGGRKQQIEDRAKYKRACAGDIAYNMMRMWQGAVGVVPADGLVSPAYVVAVPFEEVEPRFYAYLFRTAAYMDEVDGYSRGIVSDRNRLYWDDFKRMPSLFPPLDEQRRIVAVLDAHDAKVRRFVRAKRRMIGLLEERKRAVAIEILTPDEVRYQRARLKDVCREIVGGSTPRASEPEYWDGEIVWVTPRDISANSELFGSARRITEAGLRSCAARMVPAGSIIVTSRAPVGNVAVARVPLCTNQGCKALVPDGGAVSSDYLRLAVLMLVERMQTEATGTTFVEISTSRMAALPLRLPTLKDQDRLVARVHAETAEIDTAIARIEREIALVREYRERLVADVVTGKLDVRSVKLDDETLSEERDEDALLDAEDDEDEGDAIHADAAE